jgi:hypothetical protein
MQRKETIFDNVNEEKIIQKTSDINVKDRPVRVKQALCHEALAKFYQDPDRSNYAYEQLIAARKVYIQLEKQEDVDRVNDELRKRGFPHTRQSLFPPGQDAAETLPDSQRDKVKSKHSCLIL